MLHDALDLCAGPGRHPLAQDRRPPASAPTRSAPACTARQVRRGTDVCIIGVGKMLAAAAEAGRDRSRPRASSVTVWDPRVVKPLDPTMLDDAAGHPVRGHRRGRPARRRRRLGDRRRSCAAVAHGGGPAGRACWACPTAYIPHGKPDAILAELGLDADGIAATVRDLRC